MTKIVSSKYKLCRKLLTSLWGSNKDAVKKRNYKPGQHGQNTKNKPSDYGLHLNAKQRLRFHYGYINERQFRNIFSMALKKKGNTGENFVGLLERRIVSAVYRMKFAPTIFAARQLVSHGHVKVNGKRVNIPSYRLQEGDIIELKENSKQIPLIVESIASQDRKVPDYLSVDPSSMTGKFARVPLISDVPYPFEPELHLVVELYSR